MVNAPRFLAPSATRSILWLVVPVLVLAALVSAPPTAGATDYHFPWAANGSPNGALVPAWIAIDGGGSKVLAAVLTVLPGRTEPEVIASFQTSAPRGLSLLKQTICDVSIEAFTEAQRAEGRLALQRALSVALPGDYRHGGFTVRTGENLASYAGEWNGVDLRIPLATSLRGLHPAEVFVLGDGPASAVGRIDLLRDPETGALVPGSALKVIKPGTGTGRGLVRVTEGGQLHLGMTHEGLTSLPTNGFRFGDHLDDVAVSLDVLPDASGFLLSFQREGYDPRTEKVPGRLGRLWSNLMSGKDLARMLVHLERGLMAVGHPPVLSRIAEHSGNGLDTRLLNEVVLTDSAAPPLAKSAAHWISAMSGHAVGRLLLGLHGGQLQQPSWPEADQAALQNTTTKFLLTGAFSHLGAPQGRRMGEAARRVMAGRVHFEQGDRFRQHLVAIGSWHAARQHRPTRATLP